jgi:hypothetical protein
MIVADCQVSCIRAAVARRQIHVAFAMLRQWCTNVMRSRLGLTKDVAKMIRQATSTALSPGPRPDSRAQIKAGVLMAKSNSSEGE